MENHWVWSRLALGSVLPFHFFPEDRKVCRTFTAVTGLSEEKAQDNMNEWMNISVRQMYSMRIQDEDASLAAGVKQDAALDRWRTMHERRVTQCCKLIAPACSLHTLDCSGSLYQSSCRCSSPCFPVGPPSWLPLPAFRMFTPDASIRVAIQGQCRAQVGGTLVSNVRHCKENQR